MQVEEFDREKKNQAWKMTADKGLCEIVGWE